MVDLTPLGYMFQYKPLLIGGKAMEFYGLRKSGDDIDFVIAESDWTELAKLFPYNTKDLFGDRGIIVPPFEVWTCIQLNKYDYLSENAIVQKDYLVISLEKLLFLKTIAAFNPYNEKVDEKNQRDVKLLVKKISDTQYGKDTLKK